MLRQSCSFIILALISLSLTACLNEGLDTITPEADSVNPPSTNPSPSPSPSPTPTLSKTLMMTGQYTDMTSQVRPFETFKVQYGDNDPTFVQWVPSLTGANAGVVIHFVPYGGISWSDQSVDAKWVAKGNGYHLDEDGPYFAMNPTSGIQFEIVPPTQAAAEGFPYSFNNMHFLVVYGRFHVGGDLQNDIEDMKNGIRFAHSMSMVDKTKIGITSGSWGGIGILHSVAQLGAEFMPKALGLQYPVSDAKKLFTYLDVTVRAGTSNSAKLDEYDIFFNPYKRRIDKATEALAGRSTRYDLYTHTNLSNITSDIFVLHDDWDTLVPSSHTVDLLNSVGSTNKVAYYHRHATPVNFSNFILSHYQASEAMSGTSTQMWTYSYLLTKLMPESAQKISFYHSAATIEQFQYVVSQRAAGRNTSFFNDVLKMYCVPNLLLVDGNNDQYSGAAKDVVLVLMNNFYQSNWAASSDAACDKLTTHPPF